MMFKYLQVPLSATLSYQGFTNCDYCKKYAECVGVGYVDDDKENICISCIRAGKNGFHHTTEIGKIEKGQLKRDGLPISLPEGFSQNAIDELERTPFIPTKQGEQWLVCCNDFMVYKGVWQPNDFRKTSINSNSGKELFHKMTSSMDGHLWQESEETNGPDFTEWFDREVDYYVFECKSCDSNRGYWDL